MGRSENPENLEKIRKIYNIFFWLHFCRIDWIIFFFFWIWCVMSAHEKFISRENSWRNFFFRIFRLKFFFGLIFFGWKIRKKIYKKKIYFQDFWGKIRKIRNLEQIKTKFRRLQFFVLRIKKFEIRTRYSLKISFKTYYRCSFRLWDVPDQSLLLIFLKLKIKWH